MTSLSLSVLVASRRGGGGSRAVGESSSPRGVAADVCCLGAGLVGGGVKRRGCLRGGDSHMEDSVEEKDLWCGEGLGVAKVMFHPCRIHAVKSYTTQNLKT